MPAAASAWQQALDATLRFPAVGKQVQTSGRGRQCQERGQQVLKIGLFRLDTGQALPPAVKQLAPVGNFSRCPTKTQIGSFRFGAEI
jgi:hypothetical protein